MPAAGVHRLPNGGRHSVRTAAGPGCPQGFPPQPVAGRSRLFDCGSGACVAAACVPGADGTGPMIDREKVLTVLRRRFPGATPQDLAAAANAIVGLEDEWDDVTDREPDLLVHLSRSCGPGCCVDQAVREVTDFRLLVRRS